MMSVTDVYRVGRSATIVPTIVAVFSILLVVDGTANAALIGHWTLDDGLTDPGASTAVDSSPNGHHGVVMNVDDVQWIAGDDAVYGGALDFEFSTSYVQIEIGDDLPIGTDPRTLAAWVKIPVVDGDLKFLSYGTPASGEAFNFTIQLQNGEPAIWQRHFGGNFRYPGAFEDEWMHVAIVVAEGAETTDDVQVFLNGEESIGERGAGQTQILNTGLSDLILGASFEGPGDYQFEGQIDDVWLFDEALDQDTIRLIMNGEFGDREPRLQPGDADQDLDFDQLDLVKVQIAAKYLSGQAATWGEGDWNGGPGGAPGAPPAGNGLFDQLDIIAALAPGHYLTGPYAAIGRNGRVGDGQTSIVYDAGSGEISVDAPAGTELTSINMDSAAGIFTGEAAENLGGSFDNDADNNIFKATFGGSFGSISFGNVAQAGLTEQFLLDDLTVVGSLAGGGALGNVDLVYVPEPTTLLLALVAAVGVAGIGGYPRGSQRGGPRVR